MSFIFVIYTNILDDNVGDMGNKFIDYIKICAIVDSEEGRLRLQRDLDQLCQWAEERQIEFDSNKCEVLHFSKSK